MATPTNPAKRPIKKWIILMVAPFVGLIAVALLQIIVHFIFQPASDQTTGIGSVVVTITNIFSIIIGFLSAIGIMLIPLWGILLAITVSNNDDIAKKIK